MNGSVEDCKRACTGFGLCKSFDYHKGKYKCDLSNKNYQEVGLKTDYSGNPYDHYFKRINSTRFTSVYTAFNKVCGINEGGIGQDATFNCRCVGGYSIFSDSAAAAMFYKLVTPDGEEIQFAIQNFDYDHSKYKAEWRHANRKPFALIMRFFKYSKMKDDSSLFGRKTGEY